MIEIHRLPHLIYICFFYIFITYVFFIRGNFFATDIPFSSIINNSTIIIPFSTVILILYYIINTSQYWFSNPQNHYNRKFNVLKPPKSYFLLFLSILLSFFINFFITGKHEQESLIRFLLEIILNFLVIYIGYYSVRQITSIEKIFTTIQISSLISIWAVWSITSKVEKVRRIGVNPDTETGLSVAVAQLGHALAIVAIISTFRILIYWFMRSKQNHNHNKILLILNIVMVFLSAIGMFLTGSKGSLVGFLTYPMLLIVLNISRKKIWQYLLFYSGLTIFTLLVLIPFLDFNIIEGKYGSLLRRYTLEGFTNGIESRLDVFQATFDSIGNMNYLIFGKMWGYQPISNDLSNHIIYPHNIFLSILLHLGILPLISFAFIIFRIIYEFFLNQYKLNKLKNNKNLTAKDQLITYNWLVYVTIFAIFLVAFIHVLKGGRLTRVITIFFILGLLEGYNDNLKNYFKKVKQYKNKIRYIKTK